MINKNICNRNSLKWNNFFKIGSNDFNFFEMLEGLILLDNI